MGPSVPPPPRREGATPAPLPFPLSLSLPQLLGCLLGPPGALLSGVQQNSGATSLGSRPLLSLGQLRQRAVSQGYGDVSPLVGLIGALLGSVGALLSALSAG